jgi:hypothetical protein
MQGRVPIEALDVAAGWPALHERYQDVLEKLRRTCTVRASDSPARADAEAAVDE